MSLVRSVGLRRGARPPTPPQEDISFLYVGDVHYNSARAPDLGRHYEDGLAKLADAVTAANVQGVDFIVVNGDLIDHGNGYSAGEALADLGAVQAALAASHAPVHFVFGNHDLDTLTKAQFMNATGMSEGHYFRDVGAYRVIVLDACYRSDNDADPYAAGNFTWSTCFIPPGQRDWLANTALDTDRPCIVVCHQLLIVPPDHDNDNNAVNNRLAVRAILEASGKVVAVFQGHEHNNSRAVQNGIPYYGMMAATNFPHPANAYAVVSVADNKVTIDGADRQASYRGPIQHDPTGLTSKVRGWYKADVLVAPDGERFGAVNTYSPTTWRDSSGVGARNAHQATSTEQPLMRRNSVNGRPSVQLDGVDDRVRLPDATVPTYADPYTVFAVVKHEMAAGEAATLLHAGNNATNQRFLLKIHTDARLNTGWHANNLFSAEGQAPAGEWLLLTTAYDGTGRTQRVNGADAGSDSQTGKATSSVRNMIGAEETSTGAVGAWFRGEVAEVIIADQLDEGETAAVEAYLAAEYGITLAAP